MERCAPRVHAFLACKGAFHTPHLSCPLRRWHAAARAHEHAGSGVSHHRCTVDLPTILPVLYRNGTVQRGAVFTQLLSSQTSF